ncbi:hypothetical protein ES703_83661 [subsurface metagenome]
MFSVNSLIVLFKKYWINVSLIFRLSLVIAGGSVNKIYVFLMNL